MPPPPNQETPSPQHQSPIRKWKKEREPGSLGDLGLRGEGSRRREGGGGDGGWKHPDLPRDSRTPECHGIHLTYGWLSHFFFFFFPPSFFFLFFGGLLFRLGGCEPLDDGMDGSDRAMVVGPEGRALFDWLLWASKFSIRPRKCNFWKGFPFCFHCEDIRASLIV